MHCLELTLALEDPQEGGMGAAVPCQPPSLGPPPTPARHMHAPRELEKRGGQPPSPGRWAACLGAQGWEQRTEG